MPPTKMPDLDRDTERRLASGLCNNVRRWIAKAREALESVTDEDDRNPIEDDLTTID